MNTYVLRFTRLCPVNSMPVRYCLSVATTETVMVEALTEAVQGGPIFHEALADQLHRRFGGRQVMSAHHHGVDITTVRGRAQ